MVSKGKVAPKKNTKPLSDEQVRILGQKHNLADSTRPFPTGERKANVEEINAQNPKETQRLLNAACSQIRFRCNCKAWGLENVPEAGQFITACTHVTQMDVFVPMTALFNLGRRPRFMAKAEMANWPILGKYFRYVGMQPVARNSGKAKAIEEESIDILTSGRPLTIWPEGTVTREPRRWPMSLKPGLGIIALEASRRLGKQIPLHVCVTWGAANINHWLPFINRKNVVMAYDKALDYSDLLEGCETWGETPPKEAVLRLSERVRARMEELMSEIRGEKPPEEGYWDYRSSSYAPRVSEREYARRAIEKSKARAEKNAQ